MNVQALNHKYKSLLNEFFLTYVQPESKDLYDNDGLMSIETMRAAVELLLDSGVFVSPEDLIKTALRDHSVMINGDMIPEKYYFRGRRP